VRRWPAAWWPPFESAKQPDEFLMASKRVVVFAAGVIGKATGGLQQHAVQAPVEKRPTE